MRRKNLRILRRTFTDSRAYEEESGTKISEDISEVAKFIFRAMFGYSSAGGFEYTPTIGSDEEYTLRKRNDLRPVIFTYLCREDNRLYHCSGIVAQSEEIVDKRLTMDLFPIADEDWQEFIKGDVLDGFILTMFNYKGKSTTFKNVMVRGHEAKIMIHNGLSMEIPPEFADVIPEMY